MKNLSPVASTPSNPLLPISWRFALLKLDTNVNGSADETWVSYMASNSEPVTAEPAVPCWCRVRRFGLSAADHLDHPDHPDHRGRPEPVARP